MALANAPDPFLRVTVGSPVFTHDDQKLGVVKEIRGRSMKVSAGFLRQFWLGAEAVAGAVPDVSVILVADRAQINNFKVKEPSAA